MAMVHHRERIKSRVSKENGHMAPSLGGPGVSIPKSSPSGTAEDTLHPLTPSGSNMYEVLCVQEKPQGLEILMEVGHRGACCLCD